MRTELAGVLLIQPKIFYDDRGFFYESFHARRFQEAGLPVNFVQDNHSRSKRGVLRGLHYQEPNPQGKLVRCTRGSVYDVAVDITPGSPTFSRWVGFELSEENQHMLWIPAGYAHGLLALSEESDVLYKCTALYDPAADRSIAWNDPEIGIRWPMSKPLLSPKDAAAPLLRDAHLAQRVAP